MAVPWRCQGLAMATRTMPKQPILVRTTGKQLYDMIHHAYTIDSDVHHQKTPTRHDNRNLRSITPPR